MTRVGRDATKGAGMFPAFPDASPAGVSAADIGSEMMNSLPASAPALVTFTSAINQQLALELGQFLDGGESIRASITKLGQEIEKSRKNGEAGKVTPPKTD